MRWIAAALLVAAGLAAPAAAAERENCRLFGAVVAETSQDGPLFEELKRFSRPSSSQASGWALACYSDIAQGGTLPLPGYPQVIRSHVPIWLDQPMFMAVSELVSRMRPQVVIGHLRNATSGCATVADPHPFLQKFGDRWFLFAHNGGVWGEDLLLLRDMVGSYGQPASCPEEPIDSEYLFLYYLKLMEETGADPGEALGMWASRLRYAFGEEWTALNAVVSDGERLWAVRLVRLGNGFQLHYRSPDPGFRNHFVSTQALASGAMPFVNGELGEFAPFEAPVMVRIPAISQVLRPPRARMASPTGPGQGAP